MAAPMLADAELCADEAAAAEVLGALWSRLKLEESGCGGCGGGGSTADAAAASSAEAGEARWLAVLQAREQLAQAAAGSSAVARAAMHEGQVRHYNPCSS
jgi:hypothetical protein